MDTRLPAAPSAPATPPAPPAPPAPKKKNHAVGWIIFGSLAVLITYGALSDTGSTRTPSTSTPRAPSLNMTVSQEQALLSAQRYVDMMGFSEAGLMEQLTSQYGEDFSSADAAFAVQHVDVDWNQEAVEAARSYLEMGGFSRSGLIEQLESPYGEEFTHAQAVYAVNAVGL